MSTSRDSLRHRVTASLAKRYRRERRFRAAGLIAVLTGLVFLVFFFVSIARFGLGAFTRTELLLPVALYEQDVDPLGDGSRASIAEGNYSRIIRDSLSSLFPGTENIADRRALAALVSLDAPYLLRDYVLDNPEAVGGRIRIALPTSASVDQFVTSKVDRTPLTSTSTLSTRQAAWAIALEEEGLLRQSLNSRFFLGGDSREPELAGIRAALTGSLFMLLVTFFLAIPIGAAAALYLEEFAPKNRWTDLIEININNLASVPSIVYGLLGLAVIINVAGLPRSTPIVGGIVLSLMTLPVVIIAARASIKAVPPSIRDAALSMGASPTQTVFHHVLPLAMPGIMTGSIIGMARALGETAPLLMIGMVAFVVDPPGSIYEPATALPVQIYLWSDSPERAFAEKTAAAILVLLGFLLMMNLLAVLVRRHFERHR
ncbi:MAG: phosphate ABC transporter permease PstA [Pseudomonadota bacterium]